MMASDATAARARRALLVSGVVSLLIAVLVIGALPTIGASEHQTQDINRDPPEEKGANESVKKIDSVLVRLENSPNKDSFAEQNGIEYRDGKVQVVIEMESGATLPRNYNVTNKMNYTGQGKNLAQAYVPVDKLIPLSNESVVERVRLPQRGAPDQENEGGDGSPNETGDSEGGGTGESDDSENTTQNQSESGTEDAEGLSSVAGSILATLVIILAAAYGRRKL